MLTEPERQALALAQAAQANAHAPYSQKQVGAAVVTVRGAIYSGCNVENARDALKVCAERMPRGAGGTGAGRPGRDVHPRWARPSWTPRHAPGKTVRGIVSAVPFAIPPQAVGHQRNERHISYDT